MIQQLDWRMKGLISSKETPEPEALPLAVKVDPKWSMQVIKGLQIQEIVFENDSSSRRVDPGSVQQNIKMPASSEKSEKLHSQNKGTGFQYIEKELFGHEEAPK